MATQVNLNVIKTRVIIMLNLGLGEGVMMTSCGLSPRIKESNDRKKKEEKKLAKESHFSQPARQEYGPVQKQSCPFNGTIRLKQGGRLISGPIRDR